MTAIALILLALGHWQSWQTATAADAALPPPADQRHLQIHLRPSPFAHLAQQLSTADPAKQREFADIALDTLLTAFQREVEAAQREIPREPAERHKLASWQRGTQEMVRRIEWLRIQLQAGGELAIHVDSRYQVMILVAGTAVLVAGPRIEIEPEIEREVVERYCAVNDCGSPEGQAEESGAEPPAAPSGAPQGLWVFQQDGGPSYQIADWLQCQFRTLAQREQKEAFCRRLLDELRLFESALQQAGAQGHLIDWDRLAASAPADQGESQVVLNTNGAFVRLPLPLLGGIGRDGWQRAVSWFRHRAMQSGGPLTIPLADSLPADTPSE